jgi:phenylacetate-coenzyme A ligase PaaK-like adenylate-forming protein
VFEDFVHLEIKEGQGIVTSLVRQAMPVIGLATGDHLEWTSTKRCACGSSERRFILHGRVDGQMRIWSSRIQLSEIEEAFTEARVSASVYQVTLEDREVGDGFRETMTIRYETSEATSENDATKLLTSLYSCCRDLAATHPFEYVEGRILVAPVPTGSIPRIARTGKIRPVVDLRTI